jgi:hypothetical protein
LSFRRERERRKAREKILLLPLPRASRGRRRPTVPFKTAPFGSFFFKTVDETTPFYPKCAVSFKRNGGKIVPKSKSDLNL